MHKFSPHNAANLERDERYALLKPTETLKRFGLAANMTFLDVGAGTGFFSRAASEIVGPKGKVFAADMSGEMLDFMKSKGMPENMNPLLSEEYRVPLDDGVADFTLVASVMHENSEPLKLINELRRLTRKGGKILFVDWKKQEEEHGPAMQERLDVNDLKKWLKEFDTVETGNLNASYYFILVTNP